MLCGCHKERVRGCEYECERVHVCTVCMSVCLCVCLCMCMCGCFEYNMCLYVCLKSNIVYLGMCFIMLRMFVGLSVR